MRRRNTKEKKKHPNRIKKISIMFDSLLSTHKICVVLVVVISVLWFFFDEKKKMNVVNSFMHTQITSNMEIFAGDSGRHIFLCWTLLFSLSGMFFACLFFVCLWVRLVMMQFGAKISAKSVTLEWQIYLFSLRIWHKFHPFDAGNRANDVVSGHTKPVSRTNIDWQLQWL